MWGLAAAFGPVGWVVAAVGTAATAYALMDDNDDDEYTYSNKDEKKAEVKAEARVEKDKGIHKDIKQYKKLQKKRFKEKYNVDIEFVSDIKAINVGLAQQDKIKITKHNNYHTHTIVTVENKVNDIEKLIKELEALKHESIG